MGIQRLQQVVLGALDLACMAGEVQANTSKLSLLVSSASEMMLWGT